MSWGASPLLWRTRSQRPRDPDALPAGWCWWSEDSRASPTPPPHPSRSLLTFQPFFLQDVTSLTWGWGLRAMTQAKPSTKSGCLITIRFVPLSKYRASSLRRLSRRHVFVQVPLNIVLRGTDRVQIPVPPLPATCSSRMCQTGRWLHFSASVLAEGPWVSTCRSPLFRISAPSVCCLFLLCKLPLLKTVWLEIKRGPPIS